MEIFSNHPLTGYNTFGLSASAEHFCAVTSVDEMQEAIGFARGKQLLPLGGGSNILLTRDVPGLTMKIGLRGIRKTHEDDEFYFVEAGAGENWHSFVMHCIENGYAGVENLSLIPGNVGAGPMQNIGAYGVELKDVFHSLEALSIRDGSIHSFDRGACEFDYRSSIFKTREKGNFIILSVTFRLLKVPAFNISYGAIAQELELAGEKKISLRAVSDAVIRIRRSKLPDPAKIGNAGSFFKNPVIGKEQFILLKEKFPEIAAYPQPGNEVKVAAGWLIEKAGWKGRSFGSYGVHKDQALVLVNYGGADGNAIYRLSDSIIGDIREKFGILLEREVNII